VAVLGAMIEVVEHTAAQERTYTEMYRAAVGWTPSETPAGQDTRKAIIDADR
jgi:hypothetical protein